VWRALCDLLPTTQAAIAFPVPSYGLKQIERHLGFRRTLDDYGGDRAMARYIEATDGSDGESPSGACDHYGWLVHAGLGGSFPVCCGYFTRRFRFGWAGVRRFFGGFGGFGRWGRPGRWGRLTATR
jgi:hypothetical protein